jgi:uncharacterized membrane protein YeaQ/YmgE (transglycosylase-associated protein family)
MVGDPGVLTGEPLSIGQRIGHLLEETPIVTMTLPGLLVLIVIAAVCGAVGRAIAGGSPGGLITAIALGFIGAVVGSWIGFQLDLAEPFSLRVSGRSFPILWSIVGAALFVATVHLISGRQRLSTR